MALTLRSPAFQDGAGIPARHTCEGQDLSPALEWSGVPAGARSLALVVDDPDAPDPRAPTMTWVHWVLYDLPPDAAGLAEGVPRLREGAAVAMPGTDGPSLPPGTREGLNDWHRTGWGGPCPPIGRHRYFFKLLALDAPLGDLGRPTQARLLAAARGHVLVEVRLMGTYEKRR